MHKKLIALFILLLAADTVFAQSKTDRIYELLKMQGSGDLSIQVMESLIVQYQQMLPEVPYSYWKSFMAEVSGEEMIQLIIPIYDKHFTLREINDLIDFYSTPTGKKMIEKLPVITEESMEVGRIWGEQLALRILNRLEKDGYLDL